MQADTILRTQWRVQTAGRGAGRIQTHSVADPDGGGEGVGAYIRTQWRIQMAGSRGWAHTYRTQWRIQTAGERGWAHTYALSGGSRRRGRGGGRIHTHSVADPDGGGEGVGAYIRTQWRIQTAGERGWARTYALSGGSRRRGRGGGRIHTHSVADPDGGGEGVGAYICTQWRIQTAGARGWSHTYALSGGSRRRGRGGGRIHMHSVADPDGRGEGVVAYIHICLSALMGNYWD